MKEIKNILLSKIGRLSIALMLLAGIFFAACKKDVFQQETVSSQQQNLDIQTARQWLDTNIKKYKINYRINEEINGPIAPQWENAVQTQDLIEVPFTVNGKSISTKINTNEGKMGSTWLAIRKDGDKYSAFVYQFIPFAEFKGEAKNVRLSNYEVEKFDGIIKIERVSGKSVSNFLISKGKAVQKLVLETDKKNTGGAKERDICYDLMTFDCQRVCLGTLCDERCKGIYVGRVCADGEPGWEDPCVQRPCWCEEGCYLGDPQDDEILTGGGGGDDDDDDDEKCICQGPQTQYLHVVQLFFWGAPIPNAINIEAKLILTDIDCKTGNCSTDLIHRVLAPYGDEVTAAGNLGIEEPKTTVVFKDNLYPNKPNCGKKVTFMCHAVVNFAPATANDTQISLMRSYEKFIDVNFE